MPNGDEKNSVEAPALKHWGIWHNDDKGGGWTVFMNNDVFWTTSRAVAEAQLRRFRIGQRVTAYGYEDGLEIREF